MISYFERLPPVLVAIESCGSSHHWIRNLQNSTTKAQVPELKLVQVALSDAFLPDGVEVWPWMAKSISR
jgi:hypothetical protein